VLDGAALDVLDVNVLDDVGIDVAGADAGLGSAPHAVTAHAAALTMNARLLIPTIPSPSTRCSP
jgi:hypothetical protein